MKRGILFSCVLILLSLSFASGVLSQELSDSEAESQIIQERDMAITRGNDPVGGGQEEASQLFQSYFNRKGRSDVWLSNDPNDFAQLFGSKWKFTYNIITTFNDEITFSTSTIQSSGMVGLPCSNQYNSSGVAAYTELPATLGSGYGYIVIVSGTTIDRGYYFKVSDDIATGYYMHKVKSTGAYSSVFPLTGVRLSGPTGNSSTNPPPAVDTSTCKIMAKSMTIDSNTIPTTNDTVKFTVTAISDCTIPLYYYYSYAPNYGTDDYDANAWIKVIDGSGFTASNTFSQKFTNPGYYVVVAWISPKMAISNPVNMIGCTVAVK